MLTVQLLRRYCKNLHIASIISVFPGPILTKQKYCRFGRHTGWDDQYDIRLAVAKVRCYGSQLNLGAIRRPRHKRFAAKLRCNWTEAHQICTRCSRIIAV